MSVPRASIAQMHDEMRRIADVLIMKNQAYLKREAELIEQWSHSPLLLRRRMDDDFALNLASGSAKTCAMLVTGLAAAINAELAIQDYLAEHGRLPD